MLGIKSVGKLPLDLQVFELKWKLSNMKGKILELEPFLIDNSTINYECFTGLNFPKGFE